ncbi:MAG: DNA polymerase subunit beta [Gloeocapsa sp. DLM2.Bin57]|nr:MAG: DNA polymerase subunit beta [Gloeocapsa sp. DLM2.Bin57]
MTLKKLIETNGEEIIKIALKHGAYNIIVFSSVAREEDDENSDIDFLFDYDLEKISPWFPSGLIQDLQSLLGREVDIITVEGLKERIKNKVLEEAIYL